MNNTTTPPNKEQIKDSQFSIQNGSIDKWLFVKPEYDPDINTVDYWNFHGSWKSTITDKVKFLKTDENDTLEIELSNGDVFKVSSTQSDFIAPKDCLCAFFRPGKKYSRFMVLSLLNFDGNKRQAQSYVEYSILKHHIPFIRVGVDYFKVINKTDRYNVQRKTLKIWKKDEIKQDLKSDRFRDIPKFDDFCIEPDNIDFKEVVNGFYNLYAPFSHVQHNSHIKESDIPASMKLMRHIFGNQLDLGIQYMKVLYENPRQPLPILCLVSKERATGKTTFLNWVEMIFGDNYVIISPDNISSDFNSIYANKNIIALDETVIDKDHTIERLKSIATAKTITVNQKYVATYSLPFYGKIIVCTNKENNFIKIEQEEIRFWIRKIKSIGAINTKIENELRDEIPKFLKYLNQEPKIDFSKSRMVFTPDQLVNKELDTVMNDSKTWLFHDLQEFITEYFMNHEDDQEIFATLTDIQERYFKNHKTVNTGFIRKVLRDDFEMIPEKAMRYKAFTDDGSLRKNGKPYLFRREQFIKPDAE